MAAPAASAEASPSPAAPAGTVDVPRYQEALRALGVPDEALAKIAPFVTPKAGLTAGVVSAMADNSKETAPRRALLITAAALAGSTDPEAARAALAVAAAAGFDARQADALADPARLAERIAVFPLEDRGWASAWASRMDYARTAAILEAARRSQKALSSARTVAERFKASPDFALLPAGLKASIESGTLTPRVRPEAPPFQPVSPALARAPPAGTLAARRYIRQIVAGTKLTDKQTEGILTLFFEERGIPPSSPQAQAIIREILPAKAAADDRAMEGVDPRLASHRAEIVRLAADRGVTAAEIEAALKSRGLMSSAAGMDAETFQHQASLALDREELRRAVSDYPDNAQGTFLKDVSGHMSTPSGKSIEEVSRDGVFGYVDFAGSKVLRSAAGRDPDVTSCQVVFYITRRENRWRIGGYRQNRRGGTKDAEYEDALKQWLISGGVPSRDLE